MNRRNPLAAPLALAGLVLTAAPRLHAGPRPAAMADFAPLLGRWACSGTFASGKPISALISVRTDPATGALLLRHDDKPPSGWHDLEVWGPAGPQGFRSAIADNFSGLRWFSSDGWRDGRLDWVREDAGRPVEAFVYSQATADAFRLDWFVISSTGERRLGDTLACRRTGGPPEAGSRPGA